MIAQIAALPFTVLVVPVLTSAAFWAVAIWALKQRDALNRAVDKLTGTSEGDVACAALPDIRAFGMLAALGAILASYSPTPACAHDTMTGQGAALTKGFGRCAKGACQRRASFDVYVPPRPAADWKCAGSGAGRSKQSGCGREGS